ncbi:MAG: HEAT repeat domain-containing protein [Verrucomicrobiae bacterium]|nr:HEAT repeat domain-containing protein [Verrucomicrobiae bacterium]
MITNCIKLTDFGVSRWLAAGVLLACVLTAPAQTTSAEKGRQALRVLQSESSSADKASACKDLAVYGTGEAAPALGALLADEQLAAWARIALEAIPGPAAEEALRNALPKLQGRLLVGVINSIGVRRDAQAVRPLAAKLGDANADVASAAAVALGHIGGNDAAQALLTALAKSPQSVRSALAEGCILCAERWLEEGQTTQAARLYEAVRQADVPQQRRLEATRGAILARQEQGLPLLLETLRSPNKQLFNIGLSTARELPGRPVTEALAAELNRLPAERQGPLLLAIAGRTDAAVLPTLLATARSGAKPLRLVAMDVLVRQGNVAAVPVLLDTVAESDPELAQVAKTALGSLPGKEVDDQLVARLPRATGNTRRVLVELAGQRRITAAMPELIKATGDADPAIRAAGIKALGETADAADLGALTDLLARARTEAEVSTVEAALESACARIPDQAATANHLLARLSGSAIPARCALLRVLGTINTPNALAAIKSSVADPQPAVRDTAVRALADWPEVTALPDLLNVFRKTEEETHRFLALRGCVRLLNLGDLPVQQTVSTFEELFARTQRTDDRKMLLSGLANVADPAALKLVEPLLTLPAVQAEAELAMLGVASAIRGASPTDAKAVATRLKAESKNETIRNRAAALLSQLEKVEDYIVAWQVSGPYTQAALGRSIFDTTFPPEQPGGKAAWKPLPAGSKPDRPWMIDLLAALGGQQRAGYARTWIHSDKSQSARIEFGTDDGHKLWFNGKLISEVNRGGAAVPGDFKQAVELRAGWNALLLKVTQDTGPWEFCMRLRKPDGGLLEGLRASPVPPGS